MANEQNLEKGVATRIRSGEEAARKGQKGGKASGKSRKRRQSLEEAAQAAAKVKLNDIGTGRLKRKGLSLDGIEPDDLTGIAALAMGQLAAGINGNSQAAQNFADWLDLPAKHKKDRLEIEKLQAQVEKLRAEIDALRAGTGGGSQDGEFLSAWKQSIIDGYKDGKEE